MQFYRVNRPKNTRRTNPRLKREECKKITVLNNQIYKLTIFTAKLRAVESADFIKQKR